MTAHKLYKITSQHPGICSSTFFSSHFQKIPELEGTWRDRLVHQDRWRSVPCRPSLERDRDGTG